MEISTFLYGLLAFYACVAVVLGVGASVVILFDLKFPQIGERIFKSLWVLFLSTVAAGGLLWVAETLFA